MIGMKILIGHTFALFIKGHLEKLIYNDFFEIPSSLKARNCGLLNVAFSDLPLKTNVSKIEG